MLCIVSHVVVVFNFSYSIVPVSHFFENIYLFVLCSCQFVHCFSLKINVCLICVTLHFLYMSEHVCIFVLYESHVEINLT